MNYICLNGEILPEKHAKLSFGNRAFRYGEGVVEEMRSSGIRVPFFKAHFQRLIKALTVLNISYISVFSNETLLRNIELLVHRQKAFNINKIRITLWREDDEHLLSSKDKVQYMIEVFPLEEKNFTINHKGFNVDIYTDTFKAKSLLSPFVTTNKMFKMMAQRFAHDRSLTACFITDYEGKIIEETDSNVFFANGKTIYTPALSTGCTDGVMRRVILELAEREGYIVIETEALDPSFIFEVEEIFLANDISGIRWISGYKHKRYRCKRCLDLVDQLNKIF